MQDQDMYHEREREPPRRRRPAPVYNDIPNPFTPARDYLTNIQNRLKCHNEKLEDLTDEAQKREAKEEQFEDVSFRTVSVILKFLYLMRILICLIPQHGYIQPDEFFQFTEPIAGRIFGSKVKIPWEFEGRSPLRNTLFPMLFSGTSFWFLSKLSFDPSAYWLMVLPRLVVTLFSLAADWAVSNLLWDTREEHSEQESTDLDGKKKKKRPKRSFWPSSHTSVGVSNVRVLFASSYICFTYLTHTFTNSIELVLFSVLIMLTLSYHKMTSRQGTAHGLVLGAILALGFFNRPTFLIFASYPLVWSIIGHPDVRISFRDCFKKALLMAPSFIIISVIAVISDTIFYCHIDLLELPYTKYLSTLSSNLVLTPMNFVLYNSKTSNLANHGLHARYFHFLINIPMLFGLLAYMFLGHVFAYVLSVFSVRYKLRMQNLDMNMMIATTIVSITGLSLFPHQEPRFLIPLLVTFTYIHRPMIRWKPFMLAWLVFNANFVYMYGFIHQAGVTKAMFTLHDVLRENPRVADHARGLSMIARDPVHIIFASMYLPPQHLLNINESEDQITIFDLSVKKFPDALRSHFDVIQRGVNATTRLTSYLVVPMCLNDDVNPILDDFVDKTGHKLKIVGAFGPHFSYETLKESMNILRASRGFTEAFSLVIWKIYQG